MKLLFKLIILTVAVITTNAYAGDKIIKWVDKNGVTQYGDRLPMPSSAEKATVLSKQGITVQKIEQKSANNEQNQELEIQKKYDNALLASYYSVEEIEIARIRNTRTDELALTVLHQKLDTLNLQLAQNNKTILDFTKKKKTVDVDTAATFESNKADIANIERQIKAKKETITKINLRYQKDKERFAELDAKNNISNDMKDEKKNISKL
jgi:hypothetical protein